MGDPRMTGKKVCYECEVSLPVLHFSMMGKSKDGLNCRCRVCDAYRNKKAPPCYILHGE